MESAKHYIIMGMFMKDNLLKGNDVEMDAIGLIKSTSTLANGSIIVSGAKANCIKIKMSFLKGCLKKD